MAASAAAAAAFAAGGFSSPSGPSVRAAAASVSARVKTKRSSQRVVAPGRQGNPGIIAAASRQSSSRPPRRGNTRHPPRVRPPLRPATIPLHPATVLVALAIQWNVLLRRERAGAATWKGRSYPVSGA